MDSFFACKSASIVLWLLEFDQTGKVMSALNINQNCRPVGGFPTSNAMVRFFAK